MSDNGYVRQPRKDIFGPGAGSPTRSRSIFSQPPAVEEPTPAEEVQQEEAETSAGYGASPSTLPPLPSFPTSISTHSVSGDGEVLADEDEVEPLTEAEEAAHRRWLQASIGSPEQTLAALSRHEDWQIRATVASNPSTPDYLLDALAKDDSVFVRVNVLENPNTSDETYESFIRDQDGMLLQSLIWWSRTSDKMLESLTRHSDEAIRDFAQEELNGRG